MSDVIIWFCLGLTALCWLLMLIFAIRWIVTGKWPNHKPGDGW